MKTLPTREVARDVAASSTSRGDDRRFAAWISVAFFVLVALTMLRHEMWRDELEAWLAGRDSSTPVEVLRNTRYNGHPATWYLLLHAVTRVTHDPRGMQLLHACIATIGIYVFARYAPFSRVQRSLFCFGYFPLFEYGVISREYVLGVVMLFAFCAAYAARANLIVLALLAGLLGQTSAYGLMLALALAATVLVARAFPSGMGVPPVHERDAHATVFAALTVFLLAVALSVLRLIPPADSGTVVGWNFHNSWKMFPASIVWRALVPVPPIDGQFWNENIAGSNKRVAPLAVLLYPVVLWMLRRHRAALVLFGVGSLGLLTFGFIKFSGSIRHHGHVYLLLVAALWMASPLAGRRLSDHAAEGEGGLGKGLDRAFTGLLLAHVIAALIACSIDWVRPFSQSRATARFIRERGMADDFIVGEKDTSTAPIAAYLDRRIYFPRGERLGSYIIYDRRRLAFDPADLLDVCRRKAREIGGEVLLVSTLPLADDTPGVRPVGALTGSVVDSEDFWLYRVGAD